MLLKMTLLMAPFAQRYVEMEETSILQTQSRIIAMMAIREVTMDALKIVLLKLAGNVMIQQKQLLILVQKYVETD